MNKQIDLENDPVKKLFNHYLFAAVLGMVVKSLHVMLDGIFVCNGVGNEALAAVNMIMPLIVTATAITLLICVGGSTLASIRFGEKQDEKAQSIFVVSFSLIILVGIALAAIFLSNPYTICRLLGAKDDIINYTIEYGTYMSYGLPFYTCATGLALFVRNDKNPKLAMISMVVSALSNIGLNTLLIFVFKLGLKGAAIATGLSQLIACLLLFTHFIYKRGQFKLTFKKFNIKDTDLFECFKIGIPSFISELGYAFVLATFNNTINNLGGHTAVSAFTIMSSMSTFFFNIYFGMGQGMQPIISYNYGAKKNDRVYQSYHLAIIYGLISSVILTILSSIFIKQIVMLYERENIEFINLAIKANRYLFMTIPLFAYNIITSSFFQAVSKSKAATVLTFCRGIVFLTTLIIIMSKLFGLDGVWFVYPMAEILTGIMSLVFMIKQNIFKQVI